jgi:hypothetical protein
MSARWTLPIALFLCSASATAYDKQQCVDASDRAQQLRKEGRLLAAREAFAVCADVSCPSVVRSACTGWMEEAERATPSVVVDVKGARCGTRVDLAGARVSADRTTAISIGRPSPLDPGSHLLRVEADGFPPKEEVVVLVEGQSARVAVVTLEAPCSSDAIAASSRSAGLPVGPMILGGVSLVSFGAFAILAAVGHGEYQSLQKTCAPNCQDVGGVTALYVGADVALGVGIVTGVIAVGWLLWPKPSRAAASAPFGFAF